MSETIKTTGLILKESPYGESNKIVTVLCDDIGIIHAFVNHVKTRNSRLSSATSLFAYSQLTINRNGKNVFTIREATPINVFFDLRNHLERLSVAQYFCEIFEELSPREDKSDEFLRLALNCLHLLSNTDKSASKIKAMCELRLMSIAGYMPDVFSCYDCDTEISEKMYFYPDEAILFCNECADKENKKLIEISYRVVIALRYICTAEEKKIFNFALPPEDMRMLCIIAEKYLIITTNRTYKSLDFYKSIANE